MKKVISIFMLLFIYGAYKMQAELKRPDIIPAPAEVRYTGKTFSFNKGIAIYAMAGLENEARYLSEKLQIPVLKKKSDAGNIYLLIDKNGNKLGTEGYELKVSPKDITVTATAPTGIFYGIQTLLQLLPSEAYSGKFKPSGCTLDTLVIKDRPRFHWRGMHLDPVRHFIPFPELMKMVDVMAMHKLNIMHLHLTDDEGWRIEIDAYPKLTKEGAKGERLSVGKGKPLFYTKAQIRKLIAYAAVRHITIVPEIDVPGHCGAVFRAYPELCIDRKTLNIAKPETYIFTKTVFSEIAELFPGTWIHFGGDEVSTKNWGKNSDIQNAMKKKGVKDTKTLLYEFYRKTADIIISNGKTPVGWDEIAHAGVSKKAVVMWWRAHSPQSLIKPLQEGYHAVLVPNNPLYFNYSEVDFERGAPWRAGTNSKKEIYDLDPIPAELKKYSDRILGVQCCLWSEFLYNAKILEYMALPRLALLAEIAWSPVNVRNFQDILTRLEKEKLRYSQMGLNYRKGYTLKKVTELTSVKGRIRTSTVDISEIIKSDGTYLVRISQKKHKKRANFGKIEIIDGKGKVLAASKSSVISGFARKWPRYLTDYLLKIDNYKAGTKYKLRMLNGKGQGGYVVRMAKVQPEGFGQIKK